MMNDSEDSVLRYWADRIKKVPQEMLDATESMFYLEDLQSVISEGEKAIKMIECSYRFQDEVHGQRTVNFENEKQQITTIMQKLKTYPNSQDISMSAFGDGGMIAEEENWKYTKGDFTVRRSKVVTDPDMIEFSCKDHPCQFVNNVYGVVLWNNKSWVWTHPKIPFIIRYDWYPTKGVFKQYLNPEAKGRKAPVISDWQWSGGSMKAVTIGNRNPTPEVPEIPEWKVVGNLPPPIVLLVASFRVIQPIVQTLFKPQPKVYVATGLNPIL